MCKNKPFSLFLCLSFLFLISFYTLFHSSPHQSKISFSNHGFTDTNRECSQIHRFSDYSSRCLYVRSHRSCSDKGYLNYLEIFYCTCSNLPVLGYFVLLLWLVILFYVLGNTTTEYFIPSVEGLSTVLKLSPTIAGTTLLPLGNGANDVFASIISFTRSGDGDVGLNSVLGGALFITCFVVGILSIKISSRGVAVNESSFIRDVLFFLFTLCCLLVIIIFGEVNLWFALCFLSIYILYIGVVCTMQIFYNREENPKIPSVIDDTHAMEIPLLGYVDEEKGNVIQNDSFSQVLDQKSVKASACGYLNLLLHILETPLYLPRRLTIPLVTEEKWSKPFATVSSTLAPTLLAALWNTRKASTPGASLIVYLTSMSIGIILGILALIFTKKSGPPKRFLFAWLAGGFLMSIIWTYIIVQELVSLLIAFGKILGINPSILGLTVLAWGNSVGDLISNLGMALKGGDGAQVAMSGCYAGPLFNTLVGLGLSLVIATWNEYPARYGILADPEIYETIGFLMMGLLWALVILPRRKMKLDKSLGVGLLSIYFCFLFLRFVKGAGLLKV